MSSVRGLCAIAALTAALSPLGASAQLTGLPRCSGDDPTQASAEFEAGNALMERALGEARARRMERARELAAQALGHFDRQCELGDAGGLSERGAALILLGEPLLSAQAYDAYLASRALDVHDARTRRRIEANLQPGTLTVEVENEAAGVRLYVGLLDFGPLPRTTPLHLPLAEHPLEARGPAGDVLASQSAGLTAEAPSATVRLALPGPSPVSSAAPAPDVAVNGAITLPGANVDYAPYYGATIAAAGAGIGLGVAFLIGADERSRTYNDVCTGGPALGCDAVLSERETFLGIGAAGFVLGGLGVVGAVTIAVLDATQPHARSSARVRFGLWPHGAAMLTVSGPL